MAPFIGRATELAELKKLQCRNVASLVVLEGRRRIGKTRLVEEFARGQRFIQLCGLPPASRADAQAQRDQFARQLAAQTGVPKMTSGDWGTLFELLARQTARGRVIVLLDEISWMASGDDNFLGKLKIAWDYHLSKNPRLLLILCGSVSSWIQQHIVSSTAFLGRPSRDIKLDELTLPQCNQFWPSKARISAYDKLKILSVTGGVPRYLELVDVNASAEENIRALLFSRNSPLLNDFDFIFSDTFGARHQIYRQIIRSLLKRPAPLMKILKRMGRTKTGDYSEYLRDMVGAGFLARDYTWHIGTGDLSKLSRFRLKDNFVRFYLRYVARNRARIESGRFAHRSEGSLPGWDSWLGLQFENLVVNNPDQVIRRLGVPFEDVVSAGPYFQPKTDSQQGCQIDLGIQTRFNTLYVCEIRQSRSQITSKVIEAVERKIARLKLPKRFTALPVLIHVNGVRQEVVDRRYFAKIIDFGELLAP